MFFVNEENIPACIVVVRGDVVEVVVVVVSAIATLSGFTTNTIHALVDTMNQLK